MGDRAAVGTRTVLHTRKLVDVSGVPVPIPNPEGFVHPQFRRFAGCPICNVHLQSIIRGHDEIVAAGIREVVVFHSSAQELRRHVVDLPFTVAADPDKVLYAEFGVRSSARALLDARAMAQVLGPTIRRLATRGSRAPANNDPTGGRLGSPADFLIDGGGRVVACKYGSHAMTSGQSASCSLMPGESPRLGATNVGATHENRDTVANDAEIRQTR